MLPPSPQGQTALEEACAQVGVKERVEPAFRNDMAASVIAVNKVSIAANLDFELQRDVALTLGLVKGAS